MRNIVLVILDSVRKDTFDAYCALLKEKADVEYNQCRAVSTWSVPSHASIMTGELPHEHEVHTHARDYSQISQSDTFLRRLPDYQTIGVSANVYASESFNFDNMFDRFVSISPDRRFPAGKDSEKFGQECEFDGVKKYLSFLRAAYNHDYPFRSLANGFLVEIDNVTKRLPIPKPFDDGATSINRAISNLSSEFSEDTEPFFLFTNFMDAHGPLTPTQGFDAELYDVPNTWRSEQINWNRAIGEDDESDLTNYRELYAASVDYLDRQVSSLVETIQNNTERPTSFVITSDHGENMGSEIDDNLWEHSDSSLTEGLLHVPAIVINSPNDINGREEKYVSHLDFGDLLVGLAEGEIPDIRSEEIPAERVGNNRPQTEEHLMKRCTYSGNQKYIWDTSGGSLQYRLDLSAPYLIEYVGDSVPIPELESRFFNEDIQTAHEHALDEKEEMEVSGTTEEKLRDLGYL